MTLVHVACNDEEKATQRESLFDSDNLTSDDVIKQSSCHCASSYCKMMVKNFFLAVGFLSAGSSAFVVPRTATSQSKSSLSMSSALIVQNKGGGHGELGKAACDSLS